MLKEKKQDTSRQHAPANIMEGESVKSNSSDEDLVKMLREYVAGQRISWTQLARQLGVTQNTLTNWNKGCPISIRNKRNILALMENPSMSPAIIDCKSRLDDPISTAMRQVWGTLSELDKARTYMFALECRDGVKSDGDLCGPAETGTENQAAEPRKKYTGKTSK